MRKIRCTCSSRKQTGCGRMTGLRPLAATRNVHLFSPFSRGKLGTRALTRACTRVHDRERASESRNAFLHSPSRGRMELAFGRLASRLAIEFFIIEESNSVFWSGAGHLPPVTCRVKYSCDFYSEQSRTDSSSVSSPKWERGRKRRRETRGGEEA